MTEANFQFYEDDAKVPSYEEFPDVLDMGFFELVRDAMHYRERAKDIKGRIKDYDLDIMTYMARLPEGVKSVRVSEATITFVDASTSTRTDTKKLKRIMAEYGIPADDIRDMFDRATSTQDRAGSIRIRTKKGDDSE